MPGRRCRSRASASIRPSGGCSPASAEIALTATEFDLLAYLMRRPGRVFSREQLLSNVWGYPSTAATRTVDVHIAQVRAKLGAASPVRTVRGVGYAVEERRA